MKQQILVIHGGDSWKTQEEYLQFLRIISINLEKMAHFGWKENLRADLGDAFEVLLPSLPNKANAHYEEWKIVFEKILPLLCNEIILVGHSLGGTFIAKYLAENLFPIKIKATYLVAAPFSDNKPEYELLSFSPPKDLGRLEEQAGDITIYHGEDDFLVPKSDAEHYKKALPQATLQFLANRGHFTQEHFPELVESIVVVTQPTISPSTLTYT